MASSRRKEVSRRKLKDETLPEVHIACEVRVLSVDDTAESFKIALLIHAHYKEVGVGVARKPDAVNGFMRDNNYTGFLPELEMVNCMEAQYEKFHVTVRRNEHTATVWASFYNNCVISESLELKKFPFDRQMFRVPFKSPNSVLREWIIEPDILDFPLMQGEHGEAANPEGIFLVACELSHWKMHSFFVEYFSHDDDPASLTHGEMQISIRLQRDPKFFLFNHFLVMYLIVLANMCLMSIPTEDSADRNSVTVTLLLTLVAFKFVLMDGTPRIGYLTYMDKYVATAFCFMFISLVENVLISPNVLCAFSEEADCDAVSQAEQSEESRKADFVFQWCYGLAWTLINIGLAVLCIFPRLVRTAWDDVEKTQVGATSETLQVMETIIDGSNRKIGETLKRDKPKKKATPARFLEIENQA